MDVVRAGLRGASALAVIGVVLGGTGTLVGAMFRDDVPGLASFVGAAFRLLLVLLPAAVLLLLVDTDEERARREAGAGPSPGREAAAALVTAAVGAPVAVVLCVAVSSFVGPAVRRLPAVAYSQALRSEVGWAWALLAMGTALVTGAGVAVALSLRRR
ncbi:hypothetical protein I6A84_22760 [Frankia sp. CNm7]|uniref:Uncharacterized protein n=1 Tax=Frankia nepalensis TaxID=1836974 RepID=A0A937UQ67_9ACTN|nr:hypothetical protein [Frankia nepalensis]MBL7495714.1 hypothetical protein [Frankia nepalensis]MBL7508988.1 hypothetical protein [Frankia nepalensis]MBL7520829.1 hypothetical protein [Frankia nepalensis]MBL7629788.1 hypothetical protein [Frankia nepalensis]